MPLDPDKLRMVTEKAETLSKRFDAFLERRSINDADEKTKMRTLILNLTRKFN
jgi:hypothetical protein